MTSPTLPSVLLVAHGSQVNPESALPAHQIAWQLRRSGLYHHVSCAFWRELPSLPDALDHLPGERVIVCPLFISEGYFTRTVIPRELSLNPWDAPPATHHHRPISYARPIGTHPQIWRVLQSMASELLRDAGRPASQCALVIAGHGTERDANSARAIHEQVRLARERALFGQVSALFLDEAPFIKDLPQHIPHTDVLIIPYFISNGMHTRWDIPDALGIPRETSHARAHGKNIWYAQAIGTCEAIVPLLIDRITQADAPHTPAHSFELPQRARDHLGALLASTPCVLGQVHITARAGGAFRLTHHLDAQRPEAALTPLATPAQALLALRARADASYRTNPMARDLATGWVMHAQDLAGCLELLDLIYPNLATARFDLLERKLPVTSLAQTAARQRGKYRALAQLEPGALERAVKAHCHASCLLWPRWFEPMDPDHAAAPELCAGTCRHICPMLMSQLVP